MREHEINKLNNFIMGWYPDETDDISVLDKIFNWHLQNPHKRHGATYGDTSEKKIDEKVKKSVDSNLEDAPIELQKEYYEGWLQKCVEKYIEKYPTLNDLPRWKVCEGANVQSYPPNDGGFFKWHAENISVTNLVIKNRLLVFMTYLEDISVGGETEFLYQKLKIKPERGLTIIWSAGWEFTHRGVASPEPKNIITGWLSYINDGDVT